MRKAGRDPGLVAKLSPTERLHGAMEAPGCHAQADLNLPSVAMTAALASYVDTVDLPDAEGVSTRAVRAVLRMMAKIASDAGQFRYGLRGSKLAALTEYSLSVVRRAQRYLVEQGLIERVQVGGGRASTRWRILIHKLMPDAGPGHGSAAAETQHPDPPDTAQERTPKSFLRMHEGSVEGRSPTPPGASQHPTASPPPRAVKTCEHGGETGALRSGLPRCPSCRRHGPQR